MSHDSRERGLLEPSNSSLVMPGERMFRDLLEAAPDAMIIVNAAGLVGAGDAKFAAAMAPFFITADVRLLLGLFAACLLGAFFAHRLARAVPAVRRATAEWASWTARKFPMGLALSGTLIFFPVLAAI